jgi:hypothetical protein
MFLWHSLIHHPFFLLWKEETSVRSTIFHGILRSSGGFFAKRPRAWAISGCQNVILTDHGMKNSLNVTGRLMTPMQRSVNDTYVNHCHSLHGGPGLWRRSYAIVKPAPPHFLPLRDPNPALVKIHNITKCAMYSLYKCQHQ